MPVSHLGLTVSHIPSATSFYLAALQPLGYRYIGQQGDSIGLGVTDADFFLCQEKLGSRPSPTHIAFSAESHLTVKQCYTAALNAGGYPSGQPGERNGDCKCFNAAVEDLDGNTVEFIFREPCSNQAEAPPSPPSRVQAWQQDVARSRLSDDRSVSARSETAKSRARTAMDVASAASKSMKGSAAPTPGISRSRTEPITSRSENGGKMVVGTLLGAAAGAAFLYAVSSKERENAQEEEAFAASTRSRAPSVQDARPRTQIRERPESRPRTAHGGSTVSKKSSHSSKYPSRNMRAIEAAKYNDEDDDIQDMISRYTSSRRGLPQRSNTYDVKNYAPTSTASRRSNTYDARNYAPTSTASHRTDRHGPKRSSTLPIEMPQQYMIEGPKSSPPSKTSRRGSFDESKLKRHDSGVSMHSRRSRRSSDAGHRSSISRASTAKPPKGSIYDSAAGVPLPSSRAPSHTPAAEMPLPSSRAGSSRAPSYIAAADLPLPASRTGSYVTAADLPLPKSRAASYIPTADLPLPGSRTGSYISAAQYPLAPSRALYSDPEDSDGLGDIKTVVPEDSISCVDVSPKSHGKSRSKTGGSRTSRHSSKRSEAAGDRTAKPQKGGGSRHSAQTLPVRAKEERKGKSSWRSNLTCA